MDLPPSSPYPRHSHWVDTTKKTRSRINFQGQKLPAKAGSICVEVWSNKQAQVVCPDHPQPLVCNEQGNRTSGPGMFELDDQHMHFPREMYLCK